MLLRSFGTALGLCLLAGSGQAQEAMVDVQGDGPPSHLTAAALTAMPAMTLHVAFGTGHGPTDATFEGPLLWTVLAEARAVDTTKAPLQVRQIVTLTGRDGYTATLALDEISPDFEGKQVILAEKMNGQPLPAEHFRIVVPGDKRGGRSVRDIMRIVVTGQPWAAPSPLIRPSSLSIAMSKNI